MLLQASDPSPYELVRPDGSSPIVLVCDHASNRLPAQLDLGLTAGQMASHIAWDPGAAALARKLSSRLDAPLVLSNYSRLVIDCNRHPSDPDSIAEQSAGIAVPGNRGLSEMEKARRRRVFFDPYHKAIANILSQRDASSTRLLSIHSFTPNLNGEERPWAIGVCYEKDRQWARKMLLGLRSRSQEIIGDNQPYEVELDVDYTIPVQGQRRGIPSLMLELRQDLLADELHIQRWSNLIASCCLHCN